jgi:RNA polymerase sigma-70 factor, ECF subfamily
LKVVHLYQDLDHWIEQAKLNDRKGQKAIYDLLSPRVLSICRRYIDDIFAAEDTTMKSFIKIFKCIEQFEGRGNFEAWVSRIAVFESISYLRSCNKYKMLTSLENIEIASDEHDVYQTFAEEELQWYIDQLPAGCRSVFVMYAIDGYKHFEISELLQISEGTSKSQLSYARKTLKELMQVQNLHSYEQ